MNELYIPITIPRPPEAVFAFLTDVSQWPRWAGNIVSMEPVTAGPLRIGSRIRQVSRYGRQHNESTAVVTDWAPPQSFGVRTPNVYATFTLTPIEAGTQFVTRFEWQATGLAALLYTLFLKSWAGQDLRRLRALLESSGETLTTQVTPQ